ncbi:type I DNA topoisomerase, partial [bacterium]
KRDNEREKFVPKEYWTLELLLRAATAKSKSFPARITEYKNKKLEIPNKQEAQRHTANVKKNVPSVVKSVEKKEINKNPFPPFITSSLQMEASRKLRFSSRKTMQIAQQLYEGIEIGEKGPVGLITYMRTDSVRVADIARNSARKFIRENYGQKYVGKIVYRSKRGAQDAHEAIRPTFVQNTPKDIKQFLSIDQYRLYELIWRRFIASQMSSAKLERTSVKLAAGDYLAETSATRVLFDGFLKIWKMQIAEDKQEEKIKLPPLKKGDEIALKEIKPEQHFTKPPARYSEGTLVRELEAQGIGRPSTYSQIISTLLDRKYVHLKNRRLFITELGKEVNSLLQKMFPDVFEEKFTAKLEEELDEIEKGEKDWQKVLKQFYVPFSKKLEKIQQKRDDIKKGLIEDAGRNCPQCGSPLVIRWGRYGKFIACSNFPKCKYTEPLEEEEELDEKCPQCGGELKIKRNRRGGKFIACSNYPKCKYSRPYSTGLKCPREDCDGELLELMSKKGKTFYACQRDDCKFVAFDEPSEKSCPECGAETTFIRTTKKGTTRYCAICKWKEKSE